MPARLTHARTGRYTPRVASPKRITSAVYAVFTVLAAFFVISSTYQIATAVLAEPPPGMPAAPNLNVAQVRLFQKSERRRWVRHRERQSYEEYGQEGD